ncbi:sensor histidine kinase [Desulfosarcina ovata]|uniref:histidine kinase n=1 Tax=Desulfosarcina ovata subsp. ovata TaxID=2752305 RepID=A0A5K8A629_9BACT|nr:ATP-binding protein [Desulfosarcina ovata]BBO87921.1 PAS domain-containing sensor histidine kinase [Desulfosarcina ovata subsp. ovata]
MNKKKRLIYQLFPSYLLITLVSLFAVSWYALSFTRQFYLDRTQADLEVSGQMLKKQVMRLLRPLDAAALDRLCKDAAGETVKRVTVILPDGNVVADSEELPANMANHMDREEIRDAYQGTLGVSVRFSETLQQKMMYVALPLVADEKMIGVMRTSIPVTAIDERIGVIRSRIAIGALLVALLASGVSWAVSKRITTPIERMREGARRFADGDLLYRLPIPRTREFSALAETMNRMADQLRHRMEEMTNQRKKTESVLASMREGVIATDLDQRVISINPAAVMMFNVSTEKVSGRSILEIIRNHDFQTLMDQSLGTGESLESDIVHLQNGEQIFNVACTPLMDAVGKRLGGLVVVNDVTQLRRLENMRRDFAASVSHEIKTPLTAIKGFVETLSSGDLENREETRRFLDIIEKHVNRLAAIIEELMQLSRIERDDEVQQIGTENCRIESVLNTAIHLCHEASQEKSIAVKLACKADLCGLFDATLLEQAAVNLLDNAIKYSPEDSVIRIEALKNGDQIEIRFIDQGPGIAKKHLSRLFERFYRVDKARSRKLGGTGLGLAIVKHIAQAHGGRVTVESELEKGSTFTLHLPVRNKI